MSIRIPFQKLDPSLQDAIRDILDHRKGVARNAALFTGVGIILPLASLLTGDARIFDYERLSAKQRMIIHLSQANATAISLLALRSHRLQFRREYLRLFHFLKHAYREGKLKRLFQSKNANYLCINRDGSISTRERLPLQIFKLPIGRRVVANPHAEKKKIEEWKRKLPLGRKRSTARKR